MKRFNELTAEDKNYIIDIYGKYNRSECQNVIALRYGVNPRTVRKWYSNIRKEDFKLLELVPVVENENVLVIGDIHEPFSLDGYLEFCLEKYKEFNCTRVVFIGDIIDNHYSSYHETDPNGYSGGQELELAINKIKNWYQNFPVADVIIGNHDRLIMRKAQTSAIPKEWIKNYEDVLNVPGWKFSDRIVINNIQFIHGEAGTARTKCKSDMQSTVQGHLHTQAYTEFFVGSSYKVFGSQVGCGIDFEAYSMAYAKRGKKPAIGCMVILNSETPINLLMNL
jgi:hypothetical protein